MPKTPYKVYVIQGRGQRDYADCQAALAHVPAHVETLTFIGDDGGGDRAHPRRRRPHRHGVAHHPARDGARSRASRWSCAAESATTSSTSPPRRTWASLSSTSPTCGSGRWPITRWRSCWRGTARSSPSTGRSAPASGTRGCRARRTGALHGETVGVVGLGNIGSSLRAASGGPRDAGHRLRSLRGRRGASVALCLERAAASRTWHRAADDSVSVHTLLNAETLHLIGESFFNRMKLMALLINTSRGPVVDEQRALIRALRAAAAGGPGARRLRARADGRGTIHPADGQRHRHAATPADFSSPAVAQIPRRCGEEVARVLTNARPLHVVNPDVYAPGHHRRERRRLKKAHLRQVIAPWPQGST